ncbi:hypothetical protein M405DRAFT_840966 [Rhizopogon salebrosus TDB-379]|nr:hypothetical protein M405DRAFT_840966 [Rhizopogon salebrosus TDB-379]
MALATSLSNLILSQSPSSAQSMHPETGKPNNPPPGLGSFVHYNVAEFSHILPQHMVEKGGLFLAMYQWEACVVELLKQVALRYADIRRSKWPGHPEQQVYVIVPGQPWLDGIATGPGVVKQFVAVWLFDRVPDEEQRQQAESNSR